MISERDSSVCSILVVDDEPGFRDLFTYELGEAGYRIATAGDGPEAIQKSSQESFQLVICDYKMPLMDGLETLRKIREIQPGVKTILMSGHFFEEKVKEALESESILCIPKPFTLEMMTESVKSALCPPEKQQG